MIDPISRYLHRDAGQHGPAILMYHSVTHCKGNPDWPWAVSMQNFVNQLDFLLAEGWSTPTIAELVREPDRWTGRTAVITFDDGYVDNLMATDELRKRGMRATWFIVTGSIGQRPAWRSESQPTGRLLNCDELNTLQEVGMEIGAHTHNHKRLTELKNAEILRELTTSRDTLGDILGIAPKSFAYPYGAWNERCEKMVKDAGFLSACTTRTGWALRDRNQYRLRRIAVFNSDNTSVFARKLTLAANHAPWLATARYAFRRLTDRI